jgi:hypothetical protein
MTRALAVAALAVVAGLLGAESALACSCLPPDPPELLKSSDGAFTGRLVAVRAVDPPAEGEPTGSGDPTDYIYRVGRVYKHGPGLRRGHRVRVRSARDGATCGLPRERGRLYGLFLQRQNRRWHSNSCLVVEPRRLRRAAENRNQEAGLSSITGMRRCAARLRYWTQPG